MTSLFLPEGRLLDTEENKCACATKGGLLQAMENDQILEGQALLCDAQHNLSVTLGPFTGFIPHSEAALGIAEGSTREIAVLSRVGKPIAFTVKSVDDSSGVVRPVLSRRCAQELALNRLMTSLTPGMVIPATVTHLEPFGAFVDIGCGITSMIGIENISVSRIPHPNRRFTVGQEIYAAVLAVRPDLKRVVLTHKELLGTWEENVQSFSAGMTVAGYVRSMKEYGAFVELTPNLSGLSEPREDLREGDRVSVYIKTILPERMKIKLLPIDRLPPLETPPPFRYFITEGVLSRWRYAAGACRKPGGETIFSEFPPEGRRPP